MRNSLVPVSIASTATSEMGQVLVDFGSPDVQFSYISLTKACFDFPFACI